MDTMIDVAFFAPRWAVRRPTQGGRHVWRPSVREFALFARAVAERYGGGFRDPARRGAFLPAVRLWTTWNEPNHAAFLQPQWRRAGSRRVPAAPHLYRRMHEAAYEQIKAVSPGNRVLVGGLASFGLPGRGARSNIGPLRFTRELACVDSRLRPLRRRECRNFRPLRADGFAHHPYSLRHRARRPQPRGGPGADRRARPADRPALPASRRGAPRRRGCRSTSPSTATRRARPIPPATRPRSTGASSATPPTWPGCNVDVRMFPQFLLRGHRPQPDRAGRVTGALERLPERPLPPRRRRQAGRAPGLQAALPRGGGEGGERDAGGRGLRTGAPRERGAARDPPAAGPRARLAHRDLAPRGQRPGAGELRRLPHRPRRLLRAPDALHARRRLPRGVAPARRRLGGLAPGHRGRAAPGARRGHRARCSPGAVRRPASRCRCRTPAAATPRSRPRWRPPARSRSAGT